jgi:hypothetical protein
MMKRARNINDRTKELVCEHMPPLPLQGFHFELALHDELIREARIIDQPQFAFCIGCNPQRHDAPECIPPRHLLHGSGQKSRLDCSLHESVMFKH